MDAHRGTLERAQPRTLDVVGKPDADVTAVGARFALACREAVMVGGFATIAGGVLAAFVELGIDAGHLITASVISAPAALLIAKVILPETEAPKTMGTVQTAAEVASRLHEMLGG